MLTVLILVTALLLDAWLGEFRRGHPLVAYGQLIDWLETSLNQPDSDCPIMGKLKGGICVTILTIPFVFIGYLLTTSAQLPWLLTWAIASLVLYFAIGLRSLTEHALRVSVPLQQGDLESAQREVANLVSRDAHTLDENGIAIAATESVLENGNDAVLASLFWFAVAGIPGVLLHRLVNTLDAMWGYQNPRFAHFGWVAAKLDDVLNWLPAHLSALTYALLGNTKSALHCWRTQAREWSGINPGTVMSSGAGALNICLGGNSSYHGKIRHRIWLGQGKPPTHKDINASVSLIKRATWTWVLLISVMSLIAAMFI